MNKTNAPSHSVQKAPQATAVRQNYGEFNYSEAGTPDYFGGWESAIRAGAGNFNFGDVYVTPTGDVGDQGPREGILKTHTVLYYGVTRAGLEQRYNGYPASNQTLLDQWGGTPSRYDGDSPLGLQWSPQGPAPWLSSFTKR